MKVAMFPLNGPSAASMVPPEFLELAEKAFGGEVSDVNNNDGGDSNGAGEQKMQKGEFVSFHCVNEEISKYDDSYGSYIEEKYCKSQL